MNFSIDWHIPGRVLQVTYHSDVTIEDLNVMSQMLNDRLDDGEAPVHLLTDSREMGSTPTNILKIRESLDVFNRPEWGWIVLVGASPMTNFLLKMISQVFGISVKTAGSIEEAEKILQRVDDSLSASN